MWKASDLCKIILVLSVMFGKFLRIYVILMRAREKERERDRDREIKYGGASYWTQWTVINYTGHSFILGDFSNPLI